LAHILQNSDITEVSQLTHNTREWVYNALDVCVTFEVRDQLVPLFDDTTRKTYQLSKSLQAPVLDMSMRGLLVDERNRAQTLAKYREQIAFLENNLTQLVRDGIGLDLPVNVFDKRTGKWKVWWRSVPRLKNLFYDVLGLPPVRKRNAQGKFAPTINREALEKLSVYFIAEPFCAHILALRDLDKKRSFLETGIDDDGRMRCNFNIAGTNTGRLASSLSDFGTGGNLQNVDRDLRYTFVADPGYVFVNLDGEQADARNVGAVCWNLFLDKFGPEFAGAYLDACESGDLHTTVCKMAWRDLDWGDDPSGWRAVADVIAYRSDSYRQLAKKLGHGTNYYGQPKTMAKHTKVQVAIIQEFQNRYFEAFPAIPLWHKWVSEQLRSVSYITSLMGRRRSFFGRGYEDETLREAIAYCGQSPTADEIDTGIMQIWRAAKRFDAQMLVQVHDSILLQVPVSNVNDAVPELTRLMHAPMILAGGREFVVPIEAKVGFNWGDHTPAFTDASGKFHDEVNPDGLRKWKGKLTVERQHLYQPKRRLSLLTDL
jgi:DNA polymerase-1